MIESLVIASGSGLSAADMNELPLMFCWPVEVELAEESGAEASEHDDAFARNVGQRVAFSRHRVERAFRTGLLVPR